MSLESKAKTMIQIQEDYNKLPDGLSDAKYMAELEREWVPLLDAQKEIAELKTANDFLNQENKTLGELTAKIEAVNKAMNEEWCNDCDTAKMAGCVEMCPVIKVKNALLIPRIDEQKQEAKAVE